MTLVDQPCSEGIVSKLRTTYQDILFDSLFQLANGFRIEVSLDLCLGVGTASNVPEYTILSLACQISAKSRLIGYCILPSSASLAMPISVTASTRARASATSGSLARSVGMRDRYRLVACDQNLTSGFVASACDPWAPWTIDRGQSSGVFGRECGKHSRFFSASSPRVAST